MSNPFKLDIAKVCMVCKNTVSNDRRTLTEARILVQAGLEVVVVGLRGKTRSLFEIQDGFVILRVPPALGLASTFRDRLYLPIYRRFPGFGRKPARVAYRGIVFGLRLVERRLKGLTIYVRLIKALLREQAHYYHAHHPVLLMAVTFLIAAFLRRRFIWDYNDILVLERPQILTDGYYEQDALWGKPITAKEKERINSTICSIPCDAQSILDVGCGDGRITNRLVNLYPKVVAVDISKAALQHVHAETIHGAAENLPFENRSFDLVMATELLEHLPKQVYRQALREIQRISRRWILVGVPWKEQLSLSHSRCIRCGTVFHVNYHCRSFDESSLRKLFAPDFRLVKLDLTGGKVRRYNAFLLWIKQHLGGIWARTPATLCPCCKPRLYPGAFPERNAISRFCDAKNERTNLDKALEKSYAIALYERIGV